LGLGSRLVRHAEAEAAAAGFRLVELWATLTGVPLYRKLGYQEVSRFGIPVGNGATVAAVHMARILGADAASAA
jgi:ribosomal protein S18 acetylase RimI-like enzyme